MATQERVRALDSSRSAKISAADLPASTAARAPAAPLPRHVLVFYALPSIATHFAMTLMGIYFFKFATDELRVAPALMGLLFAGARLWDGLSDPIHASHARSGNVGLW